MSVSRLQRLLSGLGRGLVPVIPFAASRVHHLSCSLLCECVTQALSDPMMSLCCDCPYLRL